MPTSRRRALVALAEAVARGELVMDPGADPHEVRCQLVRLPGIGPWTAEYVALRALRDPDAFMPTDLGIRRGARVIGLADTPGHLVAHAERWRPWRSYAMAHLWSLPDPERTSRPSGALAGADGTGTTDKTHTIDTAQKTDKKGRAA
jgi:AraC family transcriptional regulator of adaptative response / DNA-3-methyladenine glycosylase II